MIICKATKKHYDRLVKDGWTDKYNNWDNKNRFNAFCISNVISKEIFFNCSSMKFDEEYINDVNYDIVELVDNEWIYIQKYENVINDDIILKWNSK